MGIWQYEYNVLGDLIKQTDSKGQKTTLQYDKLGRLIRRAEPDLVSNWIYDNCSKGVGKLCSITSDNGYTRTYTYDGYGRENSTTTHIDNTNYSMTNTYHPDGSVNTISYPSGLTIKHNYSALGYLSEIRNNQTNQLYWKADSVDAEGHVAQQTYGNNIVTNKQYIPISGMPTAITSGPGNAIQNLSYTYNTALLSSRTDNNLGWTESFTYDNLNRLTSSTVNSSSAGVIAKTYNYDDIGNMTGRSDIGNYVYGNTNNRPHAMAQINLNNGGKRVYQYDANGNTVKELHYDASNNAVTSKGRSITYTSYNMPQSITGNGTTYAFTYGPEHQRVKQVSPKGTRLYIHPDQKGGLFYEKDTLSNGTVIHNHYINADGKVIATIKQSGINENIQYLHYDNVNSVVVVTDANANVLEKMSYEPFGLRRELTGADDADRVLVAVNVDRGFTSHEHLDELDLINMNRRLYDPETGQFITADPIVQFPAYMQTYNRYGFASNNPFLYNDPSGYGLFSNIFKSIKKIFKNPVVKVVVVVVVAYFTYGAANAWASEGFITAANAAGQSTTWAAYSAAGGQTMLTTAGSAAAGAAGGAAAGFSTGLMMGGDLKSGISEAATGAVMGGVSGGVSNWSSIPRIGAKAVTAGAMAKAQGGNFGDALKFQLVVGSASESYRYFTKYNEANPLPGENSTKVNAEMAADDSNWYNPESAHIPEGFRPKNVIGFDKALTGNFWDDMGTQSGPGSRLLNFIPGINATAAFHDQIFIGPNAWSQTAIANWGTMLPSAGISYAALLDRMPSDPYRCPRCKQ